MPKKKEEKQDKKEEYKNIFNEKDAEWRAYRAYVQKLPIKERAADLAWFQLIVQSAVRRTPSQIPEEIKQKAREINEQFFTENPFRLVTDVILFKPLLDGSKGLDMILAPVIKSTMLKDMQYAKQEAEQNGATNNLFNL